MATPATTARAARTAPARRGPARRTPAPTRRRRQQTPVGGFVPVAVGRTAGAVAGIADSRLVVWLTRGRIWIGVLGSLLVGIVALNVVALSFTSASSDAGRRADRLELQNSTLRGKLATILSSEEVQRTAEALGLVVPGPGAVNYLRASGGDAAEAAKRLRDGELGDGGYSVPATAATDPAATAVPVTEPTATATDPALTDPATVPAPAETTATAPSATTEPAATATPAAGSIAPAPPAPAVSGGGIGAP